MAGEREDATTVFEAWEREHWRCAAVRDLAGGWPVVRQALIDGIAAALASRPAPEPAGGEVARATRKSCNRHADCAAAEARVIAQGRRPSASFHFHCHDEGCDECFGY